jgi:hypothetical protein
MDDTAEAAALMAARLFRLQAAEYGLVRALSGFTSTP